MISSHARADACGNKSSAAKMLCERYPIVEGLLALEKLGLTLLPNSVFETRIKNDAVKPEFPEPFAAWFSPITAYVQSGQALGDCALKVNKRYYIAQSEAKTGLTLHFPVPEKFLCLKDVILVLAHEDMNLALGTSNAFILAKPERIVQLPFPARDGSYLLDGVYGLPTGQCVRPSIPGARVLKRTGQRIGALGREFDSVGSRCDLSVIRLDSTLSEQLGLACGSLDFTQE